MTAVGIVGARSDGGWVRALQNHPLLAHWFVADVGQTGEEPFVVLADPEGNEFCVLRRKPRHT